MFATATLAGTLHIGALGALGVLAVLGKPVHADTPVPSTAIMPVSANIVAGCGVYGTSATSALNFGTLNFGIQAAVANGTVGAAALTVPGSAVQIQCTPGATLRVSVDGGLYAGNGVQRYLSLGSGLQRVPYALYRDASATVSLGIGQSIAVPAATGAIINLPIYGVVTLPGAGLRAGTYVDSLNVTLSY
ncbi:MAG: Csu type fimbrial protein [Janthinobacterium lividum]